MMALMTDVLLTSLGDDFSEMDDIIIGLPSPWRA
jgi:hypothetical protein